MAARDSKVQVSPPVGLHARLAAFSEELGAFIHRASARSGPSREEAIEKLRMADEYIQEQLAGLERAGQAATDARVRHSELFNFSPDAMLYTDRLGTIGAANDASVQCFGRRAESLCGKPFVVLVTREHTETFRRLIDRLGGTGAGEVELDLLVTGHGPQRARLRGQVAADRHQILWLAQPTHGGTSRRAHRSGTYPSTNAAVREREAMAAQVNEQIDRSLHVAVDQLRAVCAGGSAGERQQAALLFEKTLRAHTSIAVSLLEVTRLASGNVIPDRVEIDLASVLQLTAQAFATEAEARGVRLTATLRSVMVPVDAERFAQVALAIYLHAVHATPPGGSVDSGVHQTRDGVTILIRHSKNPQKQSVSDDCFDWAAALELDALSERLGLSIARANVELHGGTLSHGADTTHAFFALALPRAQ